MRRCLIVCNGVAGITAAKNIRRTDPSGEIIIIKEEIHPPSTTGSDCPIFFEANSMNLIWLPQRKSGISK